MEFFQGSGLHFHGSSKNQFVFNTSKRFISCELEIARANPGFEITRAVRLWNGAIVEDGSLPDSGFEICTAPANGDVFVSQIREICRALRDQSATVTDKCGYHVHIDARDYNHWDLRKLIILYAKIEDALFTMCPHFRRDNNYCKPCDQTYLRSIQGNRKPKFGIEDTLYEKELKRIDDPPVSNGKERKRRLDSAKAEKYHSARYQALNLHSWYFQGTVECRLAAGTSDSNKVINWALLWVGILDFAMGTSETTITQLVNVGSSWDTLTTICPPHLRPWLIERRAKFTH